MTPKLITAILLTCALGQPGTAQSPDPTGSAPEMPLITETDSLDQFLWLARPVVVFADTPNDPRFIQQMAMLEDQKAALLERDVVVIVDTDPKANSAIRRQLRPRGFMLVLIDKDGRVQMRKPNPWSVREISRAIDKTPLRLDEIREGQNPHGAG
ncbi:MAG: DUF4174 domain-containing protein [Qingshengfaniella sp.]